MSLFDWNIIPNDTLRGSKTKSVGDQLLDLYGPGEIKNDDGISYYFHPYYPNYKETKIMPKISHQHTNGIDESVNVFGDTPPRKPYKFPDLDFYGPGLWTNVYPEISDYHVDSLAELQLSEVGGILKINRPIGNYLEGDFFIIHSTNGHGEVSDCGLHGPEQTEMDEETTISYTDMIYKYASRVTDKELVEELIMQVNESYERED